MAEINTSRKNVIMLVFAGVFVIMVLRLLTLQVFSNKYVDEGFLTGVVRKVVYPSRGIIYDRRGKAILNNTVVYDLMVIPGQMKGTDTNTLCKLLRIDTAEFHKRVITAILKNKSIRPSVFESFLTPERYAQLDENMYKFNGFFLQSRPVRNYPFDAAGNVLGYLGEVDSNILKNPKYDGYQLGDYIGIGGLEKSYERTLMGQRGIEYWTRDKYNRLVSHYENGSRDTAAESGKDMHVALDIALQQYGEELMVNKIGSVVAIDPKTGGIIAMISSPNFKPTYLTGAERGKHYVELLRDPRKPLINRAVNAQYSPGSTFKTIIGLTGLSEGVITPSSGYGCRGGYYTCGRRIGCHGAGHAGNLKNAIAASCNAYFCHVFREIIDQPRYGKVDSGLKVWDGYMYKFGLGHRLGIDMPSESKGNIPTPRTYNKLYGEGGWNSCSFPFVGIGQGEVLTNQTQVANLMAYIANKGYYYTPHLVDSIDDAEKDDTTLSRFHVKNIPLNLPDSMYEAVHDGMQGVIDFGTAARFKIPGIVMCGKTGTVENYYKGKKQKDHSFFACFAPRENPKIALAVIVENGGFGATAAAPIASLLVEKYLTDTISKKRKYLEENMKKLNLIPPRIYAEVRRLDSIDHAGDSAYLIEKGFIKIIEDTTDTEKDVEEEMKTIRNSKQLEEEKAQPADNGKDMQNDPQKGEAILPKQEEEKKDTNNLRKPILPNKK
jgi:penicillin-binding protein 2